MHNTLIHTRRRRNTKTSTSAVLALTGAQRETAMKQEPGVGSGTVGRSKNSSSLINFYGWQRGHADTCPTLGCSLLHSHHSSLAIVPVCVQTRKERDMWVFLLHRRVRQELFSCLSGITLYQPHESNIRYITASSARLKPDEPRCLSRDELV